MTNLNKLLSNCPSTPLSKYSKGLQMQQKQQPLPHSLHPGSCDVAVSCEQTLTAPQGEKTKGAEPNWQFLAVRFHT